LIQRDQAKGKMGNLLLLAKGQGFTDTLSSKLDTQSTFELSQNLLVWNSLSSFVLVDLVDKMSVNVKIATQW
jgi:hypothetical protein